MNNPNLALLVEADISGEKLTHSVHAEDNLYNGSKAAHFTLDALYSVYDMLSGSTPRKQVKVTTKWDGAPSCAAASNFHGQKFVATKGFFAKDRKIAFTPEDCQKYFGHAPDLAKKMTMLLGLLDEIQIPQDQIWQGDFLFDNASLRTDLVGEEKCITFHPNTIVYAIPLEDPLAARLQQAEVGVVWHTRYRGEDFDSLKISFDANADELGKTDRAFCMDARLPSIAGQVTLTSEETAKIERLLKEVTDIIEGLDARRYLDKIAENEELVLYLNTFENFGIKQTSTQLGMQPDAYVTELRKWVQQRYDKEIAGKKQPKTKEAYELKREAALSLIDAVAEPLADIVRAQQMIVAIKEFLIQKLNKASDFKTLLKTLDRGFIPTGPEGYAISDIDGNIQKFVSRLEFSYSNFSKDIVKGWMSDARMKEAASRSISTVKFHFPAGLVGYSDIHSSSQYTGVLNSFGRGVIVNGQVKLGNAGDSHVTLAGGKADALRFYYGYAGDVVYVVSKNSMDDQTLRSPQVLQVILSQVFNKLKLSVNGKLKFTETDSSAEALLKEKLTVLELKHSIVVNAEASNDPRALVKAYNALVEFDETKIFEILRPRFEIPSTLERVAKIVARGRPDIENDDFLRMLGAVASAGVIPIPPAGQRINFVAVALENAKLLARDIGVLPEDAEAVVQAFIDDLLNDSFPQNGIVVGAGEILFALLMKEGSKRAVGDLSLQGRHVEVKGVSARLIGAAGQGGAIGKPSVTGGKIKRLIAKSIPGIDPELLSMPTSCDVYAGGPPLLVEAMELASPEVVQDLANEIVALMCSVIAIPAGSPRPKEMVAAMLGKDWLSFRNSYLRLHYEAYSAAAGWQELLVFNGKESILVLTDSSDSFISAVSSGSIAIKPFSFSSGTKAEGSELNAGFGVTAMPEGTAVHDTVSGYHSAKLKKERVRAENLRKLQDIRDRIASSEKKVASITAPAAKKKAQDAIAKLKLTAAELEKKMERR